ncbi:MAG TPA: hypothetical protein VFB84_01870 [Micromonosporaceae bacterium]|nr:hypothetical protein [Micromonosporaceae bacterium]
MQESYEEHDLDTLRAIARGQGVEGADEMEHDALVEALREAGLAEPNGPVQTQPADPGDTGPALYHGEGVGRRETVGDQAAHEDETTREGIG